MEGEQNNEGPAPIFRPVEIDLHSSGDTGFLGWSSSNTVEHEVSTTDDRNSLENEVSRVSSPVGVDRDEGLIAFMRTMMNSLNEKMDKNNEELKKNNEELRKDLNEKMDKNNEELKKNNEELRDLNYKIDQNNEELKTEIQRSNEQLKRDMEQMRGELNNKIVETTEVMRVEINKDLNTLNKDLKNLEEGVRLEINEQAEKNKGERNKLKSQVRGEVTTEIKKLKDKREEDMREIEKRFVHIEDDKKKIDQRLEKINKRFKTRLDELNGRVDRDRTNLELDQDTENGKATRDVENKSVTGSSLQEIEDMGNRVEKSLNKRLDETLGKLENKQTQLENMMRNQSMVGMRISQPANTEIFLLEFDPIKNNVHPMEFLEACKKYIEKNGEGWDFQVLIILKYMKNEAGKWGRQHINNWKNFEQFYRSFKGKYWSIGEQKKFEKELMGNEVLLEKGEKIILVTIPPIPKLGENDRYHLNKLERINEHIKSKENNEKVTVLEVAEKYYDNYDSTDCNVKLYEKEIFYKGKWCEDLIHLNKEGLTILANELRNLIRSDKKKSGLRLGVNTAFIPENDMFDELTNEDNYNKIPIKPVAEALPEILGKINKE
ncbi:hypothetical protein J6590_082164 [Homalodisca vitripennis]|nr:hypothetical protein J6590_082164 [Homalodisca vitripennis]